MALDLVPSPFWTFPPFRFPAFWGEDEEALLNRGNPNGLSVSEDEKNFYVEAALPGVDPRDVEVTYDKGTVWIKGEGIKEEKNKKYYRKASSSFSYHVTLPGEVNEKSEPEATSKNGVMKLTFAKSPKTQPKKIPVKTG